MEHMINEVRMSQRLLDIPHSYHPRGELSETNSESPCGDPNSDYFFLTRSLPHYSHTQPTQQPQQPVPLMSLEGHPSPCPKYVPAQNIPMLHSPSLRPSVFRESPTTIVSHPEPLTTDHNLILVATNALMNK